VIALAAVVALVSCQPVPSTPAAVAQSDCGMLPDALWGKGDAIDGATLVLTANDRRSPVIQLLALRPPNPQDPATHRLATQARERLQSFVERYAACKPRRWDGACRILAECQVIATHSLEIGYSMVASGLVYVESADVNKGDSFERRYLRIL